MKKFYALFLLMFTFLSLNISCFAYNSNLIPFEEAFQTFVDSEHSGECKYYIYTEKPNSYDANIMMAELEFFNELSTFPRPSVNDVSVTFIGTVYKFNSRANSTTNHYISTADDRMYLDSNASIYTNYPFTDEQLGDVSFVTLSSKKVADDFFKEPPPPQTPLVETVEGLEMSKVLQEIVGLLPIILIILASLVGLRKAWIFLSNVLKQS